MKAYILSQNFKLTNKKLTYGEDTDVLSTPFNPRSVYTACYTEEQPKKLM